MRRPTIALLLLGLLLASGCREIAVPPITDSPTGVWRPGAFVWVDLVTEDVEAARRFYGGLFGWEFEPVDPEGDYTLIRKDGVLMGGILFSDRLENRPESRWVPYLSVPDVDAAARTAGRLGGQVLRAPRDLPDRGRLAVVEDGDGAVLALLRAAGGDTPERELAVGRWMWAELWTGAPEGAIPFYEALGGWRHEEVGGTGGEPYVLFRQDDDYRGGMVRMPWPDVEAHWVPYVLVEDPAAVAARVEGLGGRLLLSPGEVSHHGAAVMVDPSGAALAVQTWPSRIDLEAGGSGR